MKRGKIIPMTTDHAVARMLSLVQQPIAYHLGAGGKDPEAATPGAECDCSGATSWAWGHDRMLVSPGADGILGTKDDEIEWCGTGSLIEGANGMYRRIPRPEVGALVVYAASPKDGVHWGHVGMVTGLGAITEWDPTSKDCWNMLHVTHCHGPHGHKPSVATTNAVGWWKRWGKSRGTRFLKRSA